METIRSPRLECLLDENIHKDNRVERGVEKIKD